MNLRDYSSVSGRRKALEKSLHLDLKQIGSFTLDEQVASSRNCENMVGVAQVPLGVAGPLKLCQVSGVKCQEYYIPMATTEGALVASVNRGCKAITESDGARVLVYRVGATRGPVFKVHSMVENEKLYSFVVSHKKDFDTIARTTSKHLTLTGVDAHSVGLYQFVRFTFNTQDAMGMNMVTIATQAIASFIEQKTGASCVSLAGNFDVDKKPSWINFTKGRGFEVWAEVTIPATVLKKDLKTTAAAIYEVWLAKCMIGSAMAGSLAFNAQFANVIAAAFLATGQDMGHVGEGSMGITTAGIINGKDVYISIYLPDLMVGTVGGGTGLATQQEALKLLGVAGGNEGNNSQEFAEIIAGSVLAGEISLLASLSEGTLARAHKTLARGSK